MYPYFPLMTLQDRLSTDLKNAMRSRDELRLRTLRLLRSALQSAEIAQREGGAATLSEADAFAVLQKQAKQRRESIAQYEAAGRDDLRQREADELAVIEAYLPQQMDDDEIRVVVQEIVAQVGATGMGDVGKVMGPAMARLRGLADGRRVQEAVRETLGG